MPMVSAARLLSEAGIGTKLGNLRTSHAFQIGKNPLH